MTVVGSVYVEVAPLDDGTLQAGVEAQVDKAAESAIVPLTVTLDDATVDAAAAELKAKMESLGVDMDATISDSMAIMERDIAQSMAAAGASVEAYGAKYAQVMESTVVATKASNDAMEESNAKEDVSKGFEDISNSAGNLFTKLGSLTSSIPLVGESFKKMGENLTEAQSSGGKLWSVLGDVGKIATVAGAGIALGVGVESIKAASNFQTATASLSAQAQISTSAAKSIGDAFLDTAGKSTFSAQTITEAYGPVANQLSTVQGHALSTQQAMQVMSAAMDLAEGSGTSLSGAASALASTMQAFQLPTSDAANVSNELFVASEKTGTSVSGLGSQLDKVKTKLGGMAPPLSQLSGLLVDMTEHGETGKAAMQSLSTSFTAFLKPAADMATAQKNLQIATNDLAPGVASLAAQWNTGSMTAAQVTAAEEDMTTNQVASFAAYQKASTAVATASSAYQKLGIDVTNTKGQLLPMGDIIGQLQKQIAGQSDTQAIATLTADGFSSASAKLVETIQAGPAAYQKSVAAVTAQNAAHAAAEKQAATLHGQMETLEATLEDYAVKIGDKLIPVVTKLGEDVMAVAGFFEHHKDVAIALAGVIGGALTIAIGVFAVNLVKDMYDATAEAGTSLKNFGSKLLGMGDDATAGTTEVSESFDTLQAKIDEAMAGIDADIDAAMASIETTMGAAGASIEAMGTEAAAGFEGLDAAMEASGDAAEASGDGLGPLGIAIGALILGITELALHWKTVWKDVKDVVEDGVDFVKSHLRDVEIALPLVLGPVGLIIDGIIALGTHWREVFGDIKVALTDVEHAFETAWSAVSGALETAWGIIQPILDAYVHYTQDVLVVAFDVVRDAVQTAWTIISDTITTGWDIMEPIFDVLRTIVEDTLVLSFQLLRVAVEIAFVLIKAAVVEAWAVIQPIFGAIHDFITGVLGPAFEFLWSDVVQPVFAGIGTIISTAWNSVIKPIFSDVEAVITGPLTTVFNGLWHGVIEPVFSGIGAAISGAWTGVIQPIFTGIQSFVSGAFTGTFNTLRTVIAGVWAGINKDAGSAWALIVSAVKAPVNLLIDAINGVISGVNLIGSLPGVNVKISPIAKLAAGSEIGDGGGPAGGFMTQGPTFLVGEGNQAHPEFVIATDPAYRQRNVQLMKMAAERMNIPMAGIGSIVGDVTHAVGGAASDVAGAAGGAIEGIEGGLSAVKNDIEKGAIDALLDPMFAVFNAALGAIQMPLIQSVGRGLETDIKKWVTGSVTGKVGTGSAGGAGGGVVPTGQHQALIDQALGLAGQAVTTANEAAVNTIVVHESGWNPNAINLTDSNAKTGHPSQGLMQEIPSTFHAYALPGYNTNIDDPLSNLIAGIRYATSRYGSLTNVPGVKDVAAGKAYVGYRAGGIPEWGVGGEKIPVRSYDFGGTLEPGPTLAMNYTGHDEHVVNPALLGSQPEQVPIVFGPGAIQLSVVATGGGAPDAAFVRQVRAVVIDSYREILTKVAANNPGGH